MSEFTITSTMKQPLDSSGSKTPAAGSRSPRLLHVTTSFITVRAFLRPFGEHFRALGWQVDAAASGITGSPECRDSFDQTWDLPWTRNPLSPANLLSAPRIIRRLVRDHKYDIVHYHTPVASFVTSLALRSQRKRHRPATIYTAHGFLFHEFRPRWQNLILRTLEKRICRWSSRLVVINHEDVRAAEVNSFIGQDHVHYMPGIGVDTRQYDPQNVAQEDITRVRKELGLAESDRLFLMIAEFNRGKRHNEMVEAFARAARPGVHLAFAGVGPYLERTKDLVGKFNLADRVHFLGFRRDVPSLIRASVATILPSEREGLSRAVMESMCLEVPVIATRIRGMEDLFGKDAGLLFPVGDVAALADRLAWALDHPSELQQMGKRARQRIAAYGTNHVLRMHEELYETVLQEQQKCCIPG